MFLPIRFEFSSNVSSAELTECFINTKSLDVVEIALTLKVAAFHGTADEGLALLKSLGYSKEQLKICSFLCRPHESLDSGGQLCDKVFYEDDDRTFEKGFTNYVAILSRAINSAPGNDSLWPYGRCTLHEIDGNVGAKLINIGLQRNYDQALSKTASVEPAWQRMIEFHQLQENIRTFGLLLCNFKDPLKDSFGFCWHGFFNTLRALFESDDPIVDKVAVRQTALQVVHKYVSLRKNALDHAKIVDDLQFFKSKLFDFNEIQEIRLSDLNLDLTPQAPRD